MTETRSQVRTHVESNPGVHFNAVSRDLDIATGQTQYHLRRLLKGGSLRSLEVCGRTHYFPNGYSRTEQAAIALLRRETTRELVMLLLDRETDQPAELADAADIARSTVEWHLSNLIEYDLAEKVYDGRTVSVRLTRPDLLRETLVEIDPSLPDRLVDRFSRLVDSLLEQ
ncbi:winged helix-turn-helix transcriptional regulator [Natronomonas salsuginis]|uniref:ArsR family transcriptional regulator n=1 Tax=Natronomonas salsuginis TaxID=2217661 RepID=A0A4U5J715_9EURY|nr:ArsR family transcriptional regulator [Natronomonas salsuginis]TKR24820.1 ArsR family transcriptional regulator [Natronomonas salsuginis]